MRLWQSLGTSEKNTSTRRQQIIVNYKCTNQSMCSSTLIRQHGRKQTSLGHPQKTTREATRSNYQPDNASPEIVATYGQIVEQHLMTMNQTRCPTENQGVHVDLLVRVMLPEDYDTTNWDNHHIKLCYYLLLLCYCHTYLYIDLYIYVYKMFITSTIV